MLPAFFFFFFFFEMYTFVTVFENSKVTLSEHIAGHARVLPFKLPYIRRASCESRAQSTRNYSSLVPIRFFRTAQTYLWVTSGIAYRLWKSLIRKIEFPD